VASTASTTGAVDPHGGCIGGRQQGLPRVPQLKALVVGGGIGGMVAALALHRAGIEVQVFEAAREIRPMGAEKRAPNGFRHVHDVIPAAELEEIAAGYKRTAGFDRESVISRFQALGFGTAVPARR